MSVERNPDLTYTFTCDGCGATLNGPVPFMAAASVAMRAGWRVPMPVRWGVFDDCPDCVERETSAAVARSGGEEMTR